jgi:hypothetical protein
VIRENLEKMESGKELPSLQAPRPNVAPNQATAVAHPARPAKKPIHITRRDLLRLSGLTDSELGELERHSLVVPRRGTIFYGRDALTIAVVARKLAPFGMDARHLRAVKQSAEREAALIDQAVTPHRRRSKNSREAASEVMTLVLHAHAALLRSSLTQ